MTMASDDLSSALSELMTRNDYPLQVREAAVHVELIPEPLFATVMEVAADTVISLGNTLDITSSLRVGQRRDRKVELALSVPDTLPVGFYELAVGSVATLGTLGEDAGAETLDDVFARVNKPDENVLLKACLTFVSSSGPPPEPFPPAPPAPISTQEDVDLFLAGIQTLHIEVVAEDF